MVEIIVGEKRAQVRGILFDKDGTLLQFISLWGSWAETVLDGLERELRLEGAELPEGPGYLLGVFLNEKRQVTAHDRFGPLAMGSPSQMIGIAAYYLYRTGVPWNEATRRVTAVVEHANEEILKKADIRPVEGVVSFLERCKALGLRLAVVTADDKRPSEQHLTKMGIRHFFDAVVGDDCVEHGKPFPDMVELACREIGLEPNEVAVIGDSVGDMEMGQSAGAMLQIFIDEELRFEEPPACTDAMIRSFHDIELQART
ncbi:HAD family hydrolase [Paenibacillus sp. UMB4589-SE434]|uniref:HAD family hydrolase n=1 Tax=Paenibacillus sp. UMB4589-SE434 TaxID=3046314 RepID=UPI00254FFC3E|nr:HAD family hydrolase [Paenibacillus sp. UMB4589-SE434]MDK8181664.1 HAD family hydrolase [Paenibacillus sp. UMB4589-SE434]